MAIPNSKFEQLHESVYKRYTSGRGFLAGDVVKFKKSVVKSPWYQSQAKHTQEIINGLMRSIGNLRIGSLKTNFPRSIGAHEASDTPADWADIYEELSPANWGNPITVPVMYLDLVPIGYSTPPVPKSARRKDKVQIKGEKKEKSKEGQTLVDDPNRQMTNVNQKFPGKKWDDSKPGGGNIQAMPGTKMKESVEVCETTLEEAFKQVYKEETTEDSPSQEPEPDVTVSEIGEEAIVDYNTADVKFEGNTAFISFDDTVYSSAIDDEIPVKVKAELHYYKGEAVDNYVSGWVTEDLEVKDANGKDVNLKQRDIDYLESRATDFVRANIN